MRGNFRRCRKFWHCESTFDRSSFVLLGYLYSRLLAHYLAVAVAVVVALLLLLPSPRPLVSALQSLAGVSLFSRFSCFLYLLSRRQTREVHFEIYVHTNWKCAADGRKMQKKSMQKESQAKEKIKNHSTLGANFAARIATAVAVATARQRQE